MSFIYTTLAAWQNVSATPATLVMLDNQAVLWGSATLVFIAE